MAKLKVSTEQFFLGWGQIGVLWTSDIEKGTVSFLIGNG